MSAGRPSSEAPARRALLSSQEQDRLLAGVAFEAIWELDLKTEAMFWNTGLESMFGYPPEEVLGRHSWWKERVHPDDLARVEETAAEAMRRNDASVWANEYRFRRKDRSWGLVASRCAVE